MAHGHVETGHPPHQNRVTHTRRDLHHTVSCRIKRETRAFSSADHVLGFLAVARTVCQHGSESSKKKESEVGTRKITEIDFLRFDGTALFSVGFATTDVCTWLCLRGFRLLGSVRICFVPIFFFGSNCRWLDRVIIITKSGMIGCATCAGSLWADPASRTLASYRFQQFQNELVLICTRSTRRCVDYHLLSFRSKLIIMALYEFTHI
jgi:hypothetical protein